MIHTFLLSLILLFGQDESEYPQKLQQVRDAVHGFMEPEDGVFNSDPKYWDQVLMDIDFLIRSKPSREVDAAYQLAAAMKNLTTGDVESAKDDFEFGLSVEPNQAPMFHFGMGLCYSVMGKDDESEKEFKLAAAGASAWARPRSALAGLYMAVGRLKEAEAAVRESIELTELDRAKGRQYVLLSQLQDLQGNSKEAETTLRQAVELNTGEPLITDYLGLHLFKSAGKAAALSVWKPALDSFEDNSALTREVSLVQNGMKAGSWPNTFSKSVKSKIGPANPLLPGGSRYRAFRFQAKAGDVLKFRTDSKSFQPFSALLSPDGKAVALHDTRSSYYSLIEYAVKTPGTYYLIVSSYHPGQTGEFTVSRAK